jgi:hypothetical protein
MGQDPMVDANKVVRRTATVTLPLGQEDGASSDAIVTALTSWDTPRTPDTTYAYRTQLRLRASTYRSDGCSHPSDPAGKHVFATARKMLSSACL